MFLVEKKDLKRPFSFLKLLDEKKKKNHDDFARINDNNNSDLFH